MNNYFAHNCNFRNITISDTRIKFRIGIVAIVMTYIFGSESLDIMRALIIPRIP